MISFLSSVTKLIVSLFSLQLFHHSTLNITKIFLVFLNCYISSFCQEYQNVLRTFIINIVLFIYTNHLFSNQRRVHVSFLRIWTGCSYFVSFSASFVLTTVIEKLQQKYTIASQIIRKMFLGFKINIFNFFSKFIPIYS